MGCDSDRDCRDHELPVHDVTIPQVFAVSRYQVTFQQWDACEVGGGCGGHRPGDEGWGRGNRPVINVYFTHAQSFVSWLSIHSGDDYRLLREAECEYVARAGSQSTYIAGVTTSEPIARIAMVVEANSPATGPRRWVPSPPMPLAYTACTATSKNGWKIAGMAARSERPRTALPGGAGIARYALCAAVVFVPPPRGCARRFVEG